MDYRTQDTPTQPPPFTPARSFHNPATPTSTRKVSASFATDCPLSGHPTIACSAVTASTEMKPPPPPSHYKQFRKRSSAVSSTQSYGNMEPLMSNDMLKPSHTYSSIPMSTAQSKVPSSRPSIATAYTNVRALPARKAENIPPSTSMANFNFQEPDTSQCPTPRLVPKPASPEKKTKSRLSLSKSRTFNAISNLRASISRTSLGQLTGNESRGTSISSKRSTRKGLLPSASSQSTSPTSSQVLPSPTVDNPSSGQVHTAQSSAYWAGRFMALQDRFQSETLKPDNLTALVNAHAENSQVSLVRPSLASSATTSCITPAARGKFVTATSKTTTRSTARSTPPPNYNTGSRVPTPKMRRSTTTTTLAATEASVVPPRYSYDTAPALLIDEDDRCRRIFMHLDALCTTSDARISLQQWQQCYAVRTGKKHLFPAQKKRTRELTFLGRLLMGGDHHEDAKRGSLGL
ncbi:hypothetical protein F5Y08DRAFT_337699 [Xylaria arbuscula]|nr:hypothetical protein F5Y08DRAFT_337699 [Xylaria arbuscula]